MIILKGKRMYEVSYKGNVLNIPFTTIKAYRSNCNIDESYTDEYIARTIFNIKHDMNFEAQNEVQKRIEKYRSELEYKLGRMR